MPIRRRHRHRAVRAEHDPAEGPLQRHGTEHPPPRELRARASLRIALGEIPHSQFQIREGIDLPRLDDPPPASQAGDVVVVPATSDGADGHAKCRFGRIIDPTIASTPVAVLLAYCCSEFGGARHFAWSLSSAGVASSVNCLFFVAASRLELCKLCAIETAWNQKKDIISEVNKFNGSLFEFLSFDFIIFCFQM